MNIINDCSTEVHKTINGMLKCDDKLTLLEKRVLGYCVRLELFNVFTIGALSFTAIAVGSALLGTLSVSLVALSALSLLARTIMDENIAQFTRDNLSMIGLPLTIPREGLFFQPACFERWSRLTGQKS